MCEECAAEEPGLHAFADGGAMMQRVVAHGFDRVEDRDAATGEHVEIDAETSAAHFRERSALGKEPARARDQIFHERNVVVAEATIFDVGFRDAVCGGNVERNVEGALLEVAPDVLPEIREL